MNLPLQVEKFEWKDLTIKLYVPLPEAVKRIHARQERKGEKLPAPYWSRVWPAAVGLSQFLAQNPNLTAKKQVLELAAGLGLPSLVAARNAAEVLCSDYKPEAVAIIQRSVDLNGLKNVTCAPLNWHHLPSGLTPDLLLLSDINYDAEEFTVLLEVLATFLKGGTTIMLSTPQRLMAKSFVEKILPWCIHQETIPVLWEGVTTWVSLYVLKGHQ